MLNVYEGQKAVVVENEEEVLHNFKVGEIVYFCGYGTIQEENDYYEYKFKNSDGMIQWLVKEDFELL